MLGLADYSSDNEDNDVPLSSSHSNCTSISLISQSVDISPSKHNGKGDIRSDHIHKFIPSNDPNNPPNQQTVERIKHYLNLKSQGFNLTDSIRSKKDFGNPYILKKVIDHYHIEEMGSNYPSNLWDPTLYSTKEIPEDPQPQEIQNDPPITIIQPNKRDNDVIDSSLPSELTINKKPRKSRWDQM